MAEEDSMREWGDWDVVKIVGTEEEAALLVGFLQASGIEATAESLLASEFPAEFGHLGEVRVRVPAERAAEAMALLNERENVATGDEGEMAGAPVSEGPGAGEDPDER
jgi:hypothetical protein